MHTTKKVAILLDGGFVLKRLYCLLGRRHANAPEVLDFAARCLDKSEELFRIYYYDCPPFEDSKENPLAPGIAVDFGNTNTAKRKSALQAKQVVLVPMSSTYLSRDLREHADYVREFPFP